MPQLLTDAKSPSVIRADELTEGDIIKHFTGDVWMVVSEPEYTRAGISFEVIWLDVNTPNNSQTVNFDPAWRFELVNHKANSIKAA